MRWRSVRILARAAETLRKVRADTACNRRHVARASMHHASAIVLLPICNRILIHVYYFLIELIPRVSVDEAVPSHLRRYGEERSVHRIDSPLSEFSILGDYAQVFFSRTTSLACG